MGTTSTKIQLQKKLSKLNRDLLDTEKLLTKLEGLATRYRVEELYKPLNGRPWVSYSLATDDMRSAITSLSELIAITNSSGDQD